LVAVDCILILVVLLFFFVVLAIQQLRYFLPRELAMDG
jgi:hypothetical protein